MASSDRSGPFPPFRFLNRHELVNRLFPQACVNRGSFPRAFTPHTFRAFTPLSPSILRAFTPHLHIVRQVVEEQVVGAAGSVETRIREFQNPKPRIEGAVLAWEFDVYEGKRGAVTGWGIHPDAVTQRSGFATPRRRTGFQGVRCCETVLQKRFDGAIGFRSIRKPEASKTLLGRNRRKSTN